MFERKERSGNYLFKLGVVPKEAGTFGILFGDSDNTFRRSDRCTKAGFHFIFENTDSTVTFIEL